MKKLMVAVMMMLGTSAAFAADSDALKAILDADNYAQAAQLLQTNLDKLPNAKEKAKAYNHLTTLALKVFDAQSQIENANIAAKVTKAEIHPLDTLAFYESAYNATINGMECIKYDKEPDSKGKVKPEYTATIAPLIANARLQLVTAGNYYAGKMNSDGVLKYWGTFLDTDDDPIFMGTKTTEKPFLAQVAYYTALYANQAQQYDKAEKYADIAIADSAYHVQATDFKFQMLQKNLKTRADSLAYVEKLKAAVDAEPNDENLFGNLCSIYSDLNMNDEANALIEKTIAANPNNFTAWAMKGQALLNRASKQQNQQNNDLTESINAFRKAYELNPDNSLVLTYLGFALNASAGGTEDAAKKKAIFQESLKYLEHAKEIDPNREKGNWAYPLYQSYYAIYGADDARTKELENLVKK